MASAIECMGFSLPYNSSIPAENPNTIKKPEEIMSSYLYLIGDESIPISGQSIDAQ